MWGSSQALNPTIQGPSGTSGQASGQLARINYGRPENWRFLFGLEILQVPQEAPVFTLNLNVNFDLIIGVGRSHFTISSFANFLIVGTPGQLVAGAGNNVFWTSKVQTRLNFGTAPELALVENIDVFPAEDIQCSARALAITGPSVHVGQPVALNVHAYFAPSTHVRPEWWTFAEGDEARYRGAEQGGT